MFSIVHLDLSKDPIVKSATDYEPMKRTDAFNIVRELTMAALDEATLDRWTIVPVEVK